MTFEEFNFLLKDREQKIRQINEKYNLEENAYIAFSGGKDSTVLSEIVDLALPGNKIPRVYTNTGIEYKLVVEFVREKIKADPRFIEIKPSVPIRQSLLKDGFPFKSKEHSKKYRLWWNGSKGKSIQKYWERAGESHGHFECPKILAYQKTEKLPFPVSQFCCDRMKKEPSRKWARAAKRHVIITGVRSAEGGQRANMKGCMAFDHGILVHFSPLVPCPNEFMEMAIKELHIELSKIYYPPYNFRRTGCKGCPLAPELQESLDQMEKYFPAERKQCEFIFGEVYNEYRRIGYRLRGENAKS